MSLCADGIMVSKDKYNVNLLKEIEVEIFIKTGFFIKMTQKDMEQGFKNIDDHVVYRVAFSPNALQRRVVLVGHHGRRVQGGARRRWRYLWCAVVRCTLLARTASCTSCTFTCTGAALSAAATVTPLRWDGVGSDSHMPRR